MLARIAVFKSGLELTDTLFFIRHAIFDALRDELLPSWIWTVWCRHSECQLREEARVSKAEEASFTGGGKRRAQAKSCLFAVKDKFNAIQRDCDIRGGAILH